MLLLFYSLKKKTYQEIKWKKGKEKMIYNDVYFEPVSVRNGNTNTNIPL